MSRLFFSTISLGVFVSALTACSSNAVNQAKPVSINNPQPTPEPCWVKTPDCGAKPDENTLYFVGQSKEPLASWGRPLRDSYHSAKRDAEQEYARFLGVDIEASSYLQSLFKHQHYQMQFQETVKESVNHTVSELIKADDYFVAYQQTSDGEPMWTVYVLLKIAR